MPVEALGVSLCGGPGTSKSCGRPSLSRLTTTWCVRGGWHIYTLRILSTTFWPTVVLWPTTDQHNHPVCQRHGWPLSMSPALLRKDLPKWFWQIPCSCWLSLIFVQAFPQLSVLPVFPFKLSQCLLWNKVSSSGFIKWYMDLVMFFWGRREKKIMGFNLFQGLCKIPEWRDLILSSW